MSIGKQLSLLQNISSEESLYIKEKCQEFKKQIPTMFLI